MTSLHNLRARFVQVCHGGRWQWVVLADNDTIVARSPAEYSSPGRARLGFAAFRRGISELSEAAVYGDGAIVPVLQMELFPDQVPAVHG
jgi:hypothetical protein